MKNEIYKKELPLDKIIVNAWDFFKENFKLILMITLAIYIPLNIVLEFIPVRQSAITYGTFSANYKMYTRLAQVLENFVSIIATMAIAYVVKSRLENKKVDFNEAMSKAFSKWWIAIVTSFLMGLFLLGLYLLLIIPGIIYSIYWAFTIFAVVLNDKCCKGAMDYSKSIVKGRGWTVFLYLFGLSLLGVFWLL